MELLGPDAFRGSRLTRSGTVGVVFAADWCPFCHAFLPEFAALEGDDRYQVARVDLTALDSPLWDQFEIQVVPSVVVFKGGGIHRRFDGEPGVGLGPEELRRIRAALRE
jgi:thioredoxin 1